MARKFDNCVWKIFPTQRQIILTSKRERATRERKNESLVLRIQVYKFELKFIIDLCLQRSQKNMNSFGAYEGLNENQ